MQRLIHSFFVVLFFLKCQIAFSVNPIKADSLQPDTHVKNIWLGLHGINSSKETYAIGNFELNLFSGNILRLACQLNVYDFSIQYSKRQCCVMITAENFLYHNWDKIIYDDHSSYSVSEPLDVFQVINGTPTMIKLILGFNF
jgi:hypothetical protein